MMLEHMAPHKGNEMAYQYRESYHAACKYLVAFGGYHGSNRARAYGRKVIAEALCELRRDVGRKRAASERRHLLFISGQFPVKDDAPRA